MAAWLARAGAAPLALDRSSPAVFTPERPQMRCTAEGERAALKTRGRKKIELHRPLQRSGR